MALWLGWSYLSLHMVSDNRRGQIKSVLRFKNGKHPSPSRREYATRGMNLSQVDRLDWKRTLGYSNVEKGVHCSQPI
jgi:hypothetical protein